MNMRTIAQESTGRSFMMGPAGCGRRQFLRFITIGCSNAIIGLVLFNLLMSVKFIDGATRIVFAQTLTYLVGAVWSFAWNRSWSFASATGDVKAVAGEGLRFAALQIAAIAVSSALLTIMIEILHWPNLASWLLTMILVTATSYIFMSTWVFRNSMKRPASKRICNAND